MTVRIQMDFTEVEVASVEDYINDDAYVFEQKFDGTRGLVVITPDAVWWPGRGGRGALAHTAAIQHFKVLNPILSKMVGGQDGEIVLDGEIMVGSGEFHVWDIPSARFDFNYSVVPQDTFQRRRAVLESMFAARDYSPIRLVKQARTPQEKRTLWDAVKDGGGEGVMAKRLDSPYESGTRVKHSVKLKFVKTGDVVVLEVNRPDAKHGSFVLGAYNEAGEMVRVGGCSAIGKPPTVAGDVIEVNYLYWTGSSIYQPRMMKIRPDKQPEDCLITQFPTYSREAR